MIGLHRRHLLAASAALALAPAFAPARAQDAASWPHTLSQNGATVEVYQPQAISWPDRKTLNARAALSIEPAGAKTPLLGTVELAFATETDAASQLVTLSDPRLVASRFPSLDTAQAAQLEDKIKAALPGIALKQVPVESITLSLLDAGGVQSVAVNNDPPEIIHSPRPASLVVFDGDPVLAPVGATALSYAVNTNWDVFSEPADGKWFLLNNGTWFAAPDAGGPYAAVSKLPAAFAQIPSDANFAAVRKSIPARAAGPGRAPTIFVSTKPAEIIVTDGAPKFAPIAGTGLQQVTNTNATLLLDTGTGKFYLLTSGRWFASSGLDGPWTFATPDLPADFALIPPQSQAGAVLASVPGTAQAQQAVIEAQIPKQATLKRDAPKPAVTYAGAPEFKDIPGIEVAYALNTGFEVLRVEGRFYVCYLGAWFVGPSPTGPWALAESVPHAIYAIPPSAPVYNVTYVTVYGSTPQAVTYGFTAGYVLGFITAGAVVYGAGYYYPPVVVPGRIPAYFPYPYTYAGGVYYNPVNGAWARGGAVYGPYGGAGRGGTYYNPSTGAHARGGAVYGPNGGVGAWSTYNPNTGTYRHGSAAWGPNGDTAYGNFANARTGVAGSTTQNRNPYGRWGSSQVSGPNKTVNTASASNARGSAGAFSSSTGAQGAGVHGARGNTGVARTQNGDVYAGHDGNVYQHTDSGWSKWNNGSWNQVQQPTRSRQSSGSSQSIGSSQSRSSLSQSDYGRLEQDRQARQFGSGRQFGGGSASGGGRRFR